jgi:hypothetical protein
LQAIPGQLAKLLGDFVLFDMEGFRIPPIRPKGSNPISHAAQIVCQLSGVFHGWRGP